MSPSPSADAEPPAAARPYGLLGLILSLVAILALTMAFALLEVALGIAGLAALRGLSSALETVRSALDVTTAGGRTAPRGGEHLDVVVGCGTYVALILAIVAVAAIRGGRDWAGLLALRSWRPRRHWLLIGGLFVLTIAWEVAASMGIEHIHPAAKDWIVAPKETPWIVGFLALAVLLGPFAEEFLFRGWMYTSLRAGFGVPVAILVTSVLFAVAHWESTHLYALAVFPVGLALAFVRERTGSIAASFVFHALYNGAASVMLFVGR